MKTRIISLLSFSLLLTLFFGCEKEYDAIIDSKSSNYQVNLVQPSDSITYNPADSLITIRISFNSGSTIQSVYCDVYASDNLKKNTSPVSLLDNGNSANGDDIANDGKFANKFPLSESYPNGIYSIRYFVTDKSNITKEAAVGTFKYNNGQANIAPIISDDIIEPDTAIVNDTTVILTSVRAFDSNGLSDIEKVYFVVYRPNGTTSGIQNVLFDDGNVSLHGDQIAGDGIYSLLIQITSANAKGTYRFEFQAKDRGGKLSNIINHLVLIQ